MHQVELEGLAKKASARFLEHGEDLNKAVFEVSVASSLNDQQTRRVTEMTNTFVNAVLVKQAKDKGDNPSICFSLADHSKIAGMRGQAPAARAPSITPPSADDFILDFLGAGSEKRASANSDAAPAESEDLSDLFTLPENYDSRSFDTGSWLGKVAGVEGDMPNLSNVTANELAGAYMGIVDIGNREAPWVTLNVMEDAHQLVKQARDVAHQELGNISLNVEELIETQVKLARQLMADGNSAATLRAVTVALGDNAKVANEVITLALGEKVASEGGVDSDDAFMAEMFSEMGVNAKDVEGTSSMATGAIVMKNHPFLDGFAKLAEHQERFRKVTATETAIEDACGRSLADLNEARHGGSEAGVKIATNISGFMPKRLGSSGSVLGVVGNAVGAYSGAKGATAKMIAKQKTPAVGAMKMASDVSYGSAARTAAGIAGVALVAGVAARGVDAGFSVLGKGFAKAQQAAKFRELVSIHPEFDSNPRAREAFDIIAAYAPGLLKSPRVTSDFISKQLSYPQSSTEFLVALAQFQKLHREGTSGAPGVASDLSKAYMGGFADDIKRQRGIADRKKNGGLF